MQAERQGDLDVASALPSERFLISALLPFRAGIEMSRSLIVARLLGGRGSCTFWDILNGRAVTAWHSTVARTPDGV